MNISRTEQRVLHVLALGGRIDHMRSGSKIDEILCVTRDGFILADCTLAVFQSLWRKRLIASEGGGALPHLAVGACLCSGAAGQSGGRLGD